MMAPTVQKAATSKPPNNNGEVNTLVATGWAIPWHSPKAPKSLTSFKSVDTIRGRYSPMSAGGIWSYLP
jgi:hypothetical protein